MKMTMKKTLLVVCMAFLQVGLVAQMPVGTAAELASMSMDGDYYLTNDIEIGPWTPLGVFTGSLDGRGHLVHIAKGVPDAAGYAGLFAVTEGAVLRNLIVGGAFMEATVACGSLAARAIDTQIENCETEASVSTSVPGAVLGGLVGVMDGGSLVNCSSNASMEGLVMGGLVGSVLNGAAVQNCYSSTSMVVLNDQAEAGYLAHHNDGQIENSYVKMVNDGWYIASIGQLCVMYGAKTLLMNRNDGLIPSWGDGYCASSSLLRVGRLIGIDAYSRMYSLAFTSFTNNTGGVIRFVHDISGAGYNIGDVVYVGGVKSFVFYILDDGTGAWVTPLEDLVTHGPLTSTANDALNGYYVRGGVYINALEVDYAQAHDGRVAHGGTVNTIPEVYQHNTGKFYTYTLRDHDDDPDHQVNQLEVAGHPAATPQVKQLVYHNTGSLQHCYYPEPTTQLGLVADGIPEQCSRYAEVQTPYGYGDFGPRLVSDDEPGEEALVDRLNDWVGQQASDGYCTWSVPCTEALNANLPIHRYGFHNGSSTVNTAIQLPHHDRSLALRYADLNTLPATYRSQRHTLAYYANQESIHADNVTEPWEAPLFLTEDATLKGDYRLAAHVAVTFDNSDGSDLGGQPYDWHSFSTCLADAPVGINYEGYQNGGPSGAPSQVAFEDARGYFPLNTPYSGWDFYCYDEPNVGWPNFKRNTGDHYHNLTGEPIPYVNESQLVPAKGYLWAIDKKTTLQAYGTLNRGPMQRETTLQGFRYAGYNLVGNPYLAYLDFDAFCADNDELLAQQAYTLLDADKRGYVTYCPGASDNPDYAPRYLHPHQGFFVRTNADDNLLVFDPSQTVVTPHSSFRGKSTEGASGAKPSATDVKQNHPLLSLSVTDAAGTKDYAAVEFGHDRMGGVLKLEGLHAGDGVLAIGHEGQAYGIALLEGQPRRVAVRFSALEEGVYTLHWKPLHASYGYLRLIDHLTGVAVDALQTDHYTFEARPDDIQSRFALAFDPTEVGELAAEAATGDFACPFGAGWRILSPGALELFDLLGRKVYSTQVDDTATAVCFPPLSPGVYLLRLTQPGTVRTQKIVIP